MKCALWTLNGLLLLLLWVLLRPNAHEQLATTQRNRAACEVDAAFRILGRPIHPLVVDNLIASIAESHPQVSEMNLVSPTLAVQPEPLPVNQYQGFVIANYPDGEGAIGYRCLGQTSQGIYVLDCWQNWGGSGYFSTVLLATVEHRAILDGFEADQPPQPTERTVIRSLGEIGHGDRDDGTIALIGDCLILGKSKYRESDQHIDLSRLK
ncbi:MAG: hypothetical protein KIS92_13760 [Planctomycetota bacterium]|nr:hypothetical protein [Planctomycetota bacterium]